MKIIAGLLDLLAVVAVLAGVIVAAAKGSTNSADILLFAFLAAILSNMIKGKKD